MTSPVVRRLDGLLLDVLTELGVHLERVRAGAYVVTLPGERGRRPAGTPDHAPRRDVRR